MRRAQVGRLLAASSEAAGESEGLFSRFLAMGAHHLASGLDHVLFVLGLTLLVARLRPLVALLTAFTLGHAISLGASAWGLVSLPITPVEVIIALSLFWLAGELWWRGASGETGLRQEAGRRSLSRSVAITLGFGLVHGLGFARAFREAEVAPADFALALFAFNLGIELVQIALALAFVALLLTWRRRGTLDGARRLGAYVVGALSVYLTLGVLFGAP